MYSPRRPIAWYTYQAPAPTMGSSAKVNYRSRNEGSRGVGCTVKVDTSDKAQKKRLEREARKAAQAQQSELSSVTVAEPEPAAPPAVAQQQQAYTVHVPGPSSELPWYTARIFHTIDEARKLGCGPIPKTSRSARNAPFFGIYGKRGIISVRGSSLEEITLCILVRDPLRFHSHFVASVHQSRTAAIRPMDIVAFGRLGTATKKVHLLCGLLAKSKPALVALPTPSSTPSIWILGPVLDALLPLPPPVLKSSSLATWSLSHITGAKKGIRIGTKGDGKIGAGFGSYSEGGMVGMGYLAEVW
ncbi:putativetRNA-splicing endonuclease subunit Sen2 [Rhizoctonia solani]|uniref:PutativetRNA-splicing endonuclease subunit Sen2 n=1 Tax=Rhizoctonia solani TaxID=456999 RepID=A0A8H7M7N5_9AGAM|nr:putativetRNA-splicing endonuclease subunit Sen2 [Rhizoctonia solani]